MPKEKTIGRWEEMAAAFLQDEDAVISVRKAGIFHFKDNYNFLEHRHIEYEINYISSGQGIMYVEKKKYTIPQGQCIIIPPHRKHSFSVHAKSGCRLTQLEMSIHRGDKSDGFLRRNGREEDCYLIRSCESIAPRIESIARLFRQEETEYTRFMILMDALAMIASLNYFINRKEDRGAPRMWSLMTSVMDYITEHYSEDISVESVAQHFGLSSRLLRYYFAQTAGTSCVKYITSLRMNKAKHLLMETDRTIVSVAIDSGYDNAQYFSRVFRKEVGMTPKAYRMQWREVRSEGEAV